jgi:ribosome-binding protein aMBF1 (putative translation factor)
MEQVKKKDVGRVSFKKRFNFEDLDKLESGLAKIPTASKLIEEERAGLHAAELIREARKAAHLSQADLAAKIEVTQARVSQMESGAGPYGLSVVLLERVARACGGVLNLSFEKKAS